MDWGTVKEELLRAERIVFLPHVYADGDALGSAAALARFLLASGKKVRVVTEEAVSRKLSFLPEISGVPFEIFTEGTENRKEPADLAVAVDVSDMNRLGSRTVLFETAKRKIRIDHHAAGRDFAPVTVCNPLWAATAEGIYALLTECGVIWEKNAQNAGWIESAATCLYTALVTDTGCFAYSNVTGDTFRIAAALRAVTGDLSWVYRKTFETKTRAAVALLTIAYQKMQYLADGMITDLLLTDADFERAGAGEEESEGLSAQMRAIEGVHVAVFVRSGRNPGEWRFSLRSDEWCDVAECAALFGGGGHARASGITYKPDCGTDFDTFRRNVLRELEHQLQSYREAHERIH